jgi:hypothetical protein
MGPEMVGHSSSTFFRQGSNCLYPHHFGNFGMFMWLCQWKKKYAVGSSLEVTRIWRKRVLFNVIVLPCRQKEHARTSTRTSASPSCLSPCEEALSLKAAIGFSYRSMPLCQTFKSIWFVWMAVWYIPPEVEGFSC